MRSRTQRHQIQSCIKQIIRTERLKPYHTGTVFARRANPPPSLLSETLRHQKWLCQAQIYYETFQSPSYKHGLRKCFGTLAVQACFREHRAIKNRTHLNPFRTMEGAAAPNPHFLGCASLLSRASRPQQQNHFHNPYMPCVCKWEGGLPPLTPPLS